MINEQFVLVVTTTDDLYLLNTDDEMIEKGVKKSQKQLQAKLLRIVKICASVKRLLFMRRNKSINALIDFLLPHIWTPHNANDTLFFTLPQCKARIQFICHAAS